MKKHFITHHLLFIIHYLRFTLLLSILFFPLSIPAQAKVFRIGVVPFEEFDKKGEWGKSVAGSVSTRLAKIKEIQVIERMKLEKLLEEIARGNTGLYDKNTISEVGKQLCADHIISGEIQGTDKEVRITARIVAVESGSVLNGVEVSGLWKDIFKLEDELTLKLIEGLGLKITDLEKEDICNGSNEKFTACEYCNKGLNTSDDEMALKYYEKAISLDSNYAPVYTGIGLIYYRKGDMEKAERYFSKALDIDPNDPAALLNMGLVYDSQKHYSEAIECYQKDIDINSDINAYVNLGDVYYVQGHLDKAEKHFRTVIKLAPENFLGHYDLAVVLYDKKKFDDALLEFSEAARLNGKDSEPYYYLGQICSAREELKEAEEYYNKALDLNKNYTEARASLGDLYIRQTKYNAALKQFNMLLGNNSDGLAYKGLGESYYGIGEYDKAIVFYNEYLNIKPDQGEVIFLLGKAYEGKGDKEIAYEKYLRVLQLLPEHKGARDAVNRMDVEKLTKNIFFILKIFVALLCILSIIALLIFYFIIKNHKKVEN